MKCLFALVFFGFLMNSYAANDDIAIISPGVSIQKETGRLVLDQMVQVSFTYVSPNWKHYVEQDKSSLTFADNSPVEKDDSVSFAGKFNTDSGIFDFEEQLTKTATSGVDCLWRVKNEKGIESERLYVILKLTPDYEGLDITIGDEIYKLPAFQVKHQILKPFRDVASITIPCQTGKIVIKGNLRGMLIASGDNPKKYYGLRLYATPGKGLIKESHIKFNLAVTNVHSESVDISESVNSSFTDDIDNDQKGGWTDQGKLCDLRSLKPSRRNLGGIKFNILDASNNNNKSCIILKGKARPYFSKSATVAMDKQQYRYLYLLHSAAWSGHHKVAGEMTVTYLDGTSDRIKIICGVDVGDWAIGKPFDNANPVWRGDSEAFGKVSQYLSCFPIKNKLLKSVTFTSGGEEPVWMIAAVSGSKDLVKPVLKAVETVTFLANKTWLPIDWKPMEIIKGSALDFSTSLDAPAGKYGDVYCAGDKFCFKDKPGEAVRFYGNTAFHELSFMSKKQAEIFADYIAATGYNTIRFHCYHKGITTNDGSPTLNPVGLDKMCYLMSCLKKRGIYYTFPVYGNTGWANVVINDPEIPEFSGKRLTHELRCLAPISKPTMDYVKTFAKNLLLHVNPYTGLAIKDDPALISVELMNENSLYAGLYSEHSKSVFPVYPRKCAEYLQRKNGRKPTPKEIELFLPEFIVLMQQKMTRELRTYLRSIGVKKPITDMSDDSKLPLLLTRQQLDYIDVHKYWDLAEGLPTRLHHGNPNEGKWLTQFKAGAARVFGKPFAQGEFNTVYPSPYWPYMGPSNSAIAGLQNWGMIITCGLNSLIKENFKPAPAMGIKMTNPMIMLTERIGSMLFMDYGVKASKIKIPYIVTREYIYKKLNVLGEPRYPSSYFELGLCCQIGTILYEDGMDLSEYPCVVVPMDMELPGGVKNLTCFKAGPELHENVRTVLPGFGPNRFTSTTGQTVLDPKHKTFSILTERAECLMIPESVKQIQGKNLEISANKTISTCFVGSIDKQAIKKSKRLLALYVTDLKNTGTEVEYEKNGGATFTKVGTLPFLLKQATVTFSVKSDHQELPRIWALKYDGSRKVEVKPAKTKDGFSFEAIAVTAKDSYFAYEIIW